MRPQESLGPYSMFSDVCEIATTTFVIVTVCLDQQQPSQFITTEGNLKKTSSYIIIASCRQIIQYFSHIFMFVCSLPHLDLEAVPTCGGGFPWLRVHPYTCGSSNMIGFLQKHTQCYGSGSVGSEFFGPPGSGSFYHQAKIVRKTLIPTVL